MPLCPICAKGMMSEFESEGKMIRQCHRCGYQEQERLEDNVLIEIIDDLARLKLREEGKLKGHGLECSRLIGSIL